VAAEELLDQPDAGGAVDPLDVQLDTTEPSFFGASIFDQLEPLVVDVARVEIRRR